MLEDRIASAFVVPLRLKPALWSHLLDVARHDIRAEELVTTSTYFDTHGFDLFFDSWATRQPNGTGKQLRIRRYQGTSAEFFEFKWHMSGVSHKRRCRLESPPDFGRHSVPSEDPILIECWQLVTAGILYPRLTISYRRLALDNETTRITLDTDIEYSASDSAVS